MHETAKKLKRRGFLLLEGVLLLAVLSALSVGTTAIFSGQFNTMNAGKQASQAQQYASVAPKMVPTGRARSRLPARPRLMTATR